MKHKIGWWVLAFTVLCLAVGLTAPLWAFLDVESTAPEAIEGSCVAYAIRCHQVDGYFIASSDISRHAFNAILNGSPSDYASWVFYEPQTSKMIALGEYPYEYPVTVVLETEIVPGGYDPSVIVEFTSNGGQGKFYIIDRAGNRIVRLGRGDPR